MKVRLPVLLAVGAFLLIAVVAARGSSGIPTGTPDLRIGGGSTSADELTGIPAVPSEALAYTTGAYMILMAAAFLFGLAMLLLGLTTIRFYRRKRVRMRGVIAGKVADGGESWVVEATRRALTEMDRKIGGPPSDAVIAAWVELEESAARTGIERKPHQTPTEFTSAVLVGQNVDAQALRTLRTLYHRARFGKPGSVTEDDALLARRALETI
ncbi:DUF4129 domain-containing protein [Kibdelosporangium philippinense]|uniref:DUF4129 domain-containing protein n=1 Tax=Kibdelosporangium philippinense TaxID=211113 RepID=A0ABS8ZNX9_9PSEU|nr:DUF4129 domain-containing protein [Kibdelosporangium philippinense]MCE7008650.1 DUF4129 domain-containing protein [Kibdelosporangium philippinense]